MRMTSSTSISGMKLISGSSLDRVPRRFMPGLVALAVREIDEADRLLLHFDDETVDGRPEMAVEDHARNRDDQPERGVVERDRDPVRELDRIRSRSRLRAEDLDHADDGAEEPEQRRHRGDRPQRREETLEIVRDNAPDLLDHFPDHRPRTLDVGKA